MVDMAHGGRRSPTVLGGEQASCFADGVRGVPEVVVFGREAVDELLDIRFESGTGAASRQHRSKGVEDGDDVDGVLEQGSDGGVPETV
ncbi:hypothetical protein OH768_52590 [Streptomyces sp. NBC_01622]|uniref:hypothetical protein n=1 Tax=Streptomyces sp. NBC_01622 TaxID=2975903 RepID=UPI0038650283|nr:hypothetical protein OH768_52590 [Streptomyces sp. NBC_01622]